MNNFFSHIKSQDKDVFEAIEGEYNRQSEGLELIPSENYVSEAVLEALASPFTNKYAEGYPGRRYYGGQHYTDIIETIAIERAQKLFGAQFINVQPLSGAPANIAVYFGLLEPGDTVLGMDLSHGGHLTHGHPVTAMTKVFNFVRYKMRNIDTGEIDYDELRETALKEKPKIVLAGFSAYSRELEYEKFVDIAREVGAITVMDASHIAGLIAGGVLKNPFDAGFDIVTTTTHKTLRGPRGGMIMVREDEDLAKRIDKSVFPGLQGGPHMNNIAGKAVAFGEALSPKFKEYAAQVLQNAKAMESVFLKRGIRLIGGGTDNHLILADVYGSLGITGAEAEEVLDGVGITLNKNVIPDDPRKPLDPSGIRFGTPAITTRGFDEEACERVAHAMVDVLEGRDTMKVKKDVSIIIKQLAANFPIPKSFV